MCQEFDEVYENVFIDESDERVFMKPGERMDVLNDVFYDEESWQEEQERYQELSEEEREMRRYEISRLSRWSTFMEVREEVLKKGFSICREDGGFILAHKREGEGTSVIQVDYPASLSAYQKEYDIRVMYKNQKRKKIWYLEVKTAVSKQLTGNKFCVWEEQFQFLGKVEEDHYVFVNVFFNVSQMKAVYHFYEPANPSAYSDEQELFKEEIYKAWGMAFENRMREYYKSVYAGFSNLIWDGTFDTMPELHFFCFP